MIITSLGPVLRAVVGHRGVQAAAAFWVVGYIVVLWLARGALPFDRPAVARLPFVAGIDRFLPASFGRMHPRWGSPVVALLVQAAIAAIFILLGQGGTSVKGAYDVLVSTTVVITMVPFIYIFASAIKLHGGDDPQAIRIPGGTLTVRIAASIGLFTTVFAIVMAVFPADDEPNKALAVAKVLGLTALMIVSGVLVYLRGTRRITRDEALRSD